MTITFEPVPHPSDVLAYRGLCWDTDRETPIFTVSSFEDIVSRFDEHCMKCAECDDYGRPVLEYVTDVPSMNVANSNGAAFISLLGFEMDDAGSWAAPVFLERVVAAQKALEGCKTDPSTSIMSAVDAYTLDYIETGLMKLRHIADWSVLHGRDVQWT